MSARSAASASEAQAASSALMLSPSRATIRGCCVIGNLAMRLRASRGHDARGVQRAPVPADASNVDAPVTGAQPFAMRLAR